MSRIRLVIAAVTLGSFGAVAAMGCSKPAANQDTGSKPIASEGGQKVVVPGADGARSGAPRMTMEGANPTVGAAGGAGADDAFRLQPNEGKLTIEIPADARPGAETIAKVLVTPATVYKINLEFPTKLTLESPAGVTLAKAQYVAGGHDKAKGDAEAFDEKQLAFAVKLTPSATGTHTVTGKFKFAVCDKDVCLAKSEQISIAVAAK